MKQELKIFLTALQFYTRIPSPYKFEYAKEYMLKSTRYLPVIGWLVGGASAIVLLVSQLVFSVEISVVLSMLISILITGGFHEDGLADVSDAFGGGWQKEKILSIMKDSRVGSYGVIALVLILLIKFIALTEIVSLQTDNTFSGGFFIVVVLVSAHALSRFVALTTMVSYRYVREEDSSSKVNAAVQKKTAWFSPMIVIAAFFGLTPLLLFNQSEVFLLIIPMLLAQVLMAQFFKKWIGGYTGDCLGAIQQVSEVVFYLGGLVLWKFI